MNYKIGMRQRPPERQPNLSWHSFPPDHVFRNPPVHFCVMSQIHNINWSGSTAGICDVKNSIGEVIFHSLTKQFLELRSFASSEIQHCLFKAFKSADRAAGQSDILGSATVTAWNESSLYIASVGLGGTYLVRQQTVSKLDQDDNLEIRTNGSVELFSNLLSNAIGLDLIENEDDIHFNQTEIQNSDLLLLANEGFARNVSFEQMIAASRARPLDTMLSALINDFAPSHMNEVLAVCAVRFETGA